MFFFFFFFFVFFLFLQFDEDEVEDDTPVEKRKKIFSKECMFHKFVPSCM